MHQVSGVWAVRTMGACNVQEERVGEEFQTARGGYWPWTRKCCISTYCSLLRRQLDVSRRPPSPPSRCHISTILWDLSSCLRSSSLGPPHQPSMSLNELSLCMIMREGLILPSWVEFSSVHSSAWKMSFEPKTIGKNHGCLVLID